MSVEARKHGQISGDHFTEPITSHSADLSLGTYGPSATQPWATRIKVRRSCQLSPTAVAESQHEPRVVPGVLRCAIGTIHSNTECASTVYARIPFVRLRGLESQDLPLEAAMVCALVVTMAWVRRRKTVSCRDSLHNHLRLQGTCTRIYIYHIFLFVAIATLRHLKYYPNPQSRLRYCVQWPQSTEWLLVL